MECRSTFFIKLDKLLLITVLVEIFLGGNGYLTEIGNIRLRVILSVLCMAWVLVRLTGTSVKLPHQVWGLFLLFLVVTTIGTWVGLSNGNRIGAIVGELKPLMYFPMMLFFAVAIRTQEDVDLVSRLIVISGIVQALAFLFLLALPYFGIISYSTIYLFLKQSDEFIFRHNPDAEVFLGFFYKGAFHMGTAALFLLLDPSRKNKLFFLIVLAAIVLTLTRGLVVALILSLLFGVILVPKKDRVFVLLILGGVSGIVLYIADLIQFVRRPVSDSIRLADLKYVWSELDPSMLFVGRGIGAIIGERERIEMTYLEVFYKQGAIGLALWAAVLYINFVAFWRIKGSLRHHALMFHLAALFVYFATATNTFLTGSIGMSVVLISTVVLLVMNKCYRRREAVINWRV